MTFITGVIPNGFVGVFPPLLNTAMCFCLLSEEINVSLHLSKKKTRYVYLPNSLDPSSIVKKEDPHQKSVLKILFIAGNQCIRKGIESVVKNIKKEDQRFEFIMVAVPEHEIRQYSLDFFPAVRLIEFMEGEGKKRIFSESDIFVLPSYGEGFPVTVLEAMATGVPIITTPVGALGDIIVDGYNGLLIPAGDPDALFRALEKLYADVKLRRQLAFAAHKTLISDFTVDNTRKTLEDVYVGLRMS